MPIMTSWGCPFDCTFCSVTAMFGRKYRFRSAESVIAEIKDSLSRFLTVGDVDGDGKDEVFLLYRAVHRDGSGTEKRERLFLGHQGLQIGDRDLVIVRVNLAERKETVTVAAKIYERCLKRGFDPGYFS